MNSESTAAVAPPVRMYRRGRCPRKARTRRICSIVGVFDVHAGDVIGEQHYFVAVEFFGVLLREC